MDFDALRAPFAAEMVKWRPQGKFPKDGGNARVVAYIDARAVMDRLDTVCGPENWRDSYHKGPEGGVLCRLELRLADEWVAKEDVADNTQIEAIKGGVSDALRRTAVKWGIGRYLYHLPASWTQVDQWGKVTNPPALPKWALPDGHPQQNGRQSAPRNDVDTRTGELPPLVHDWLLDTGFLPQMKQQGVSGWNSTEVGIVLGRRPEKPTEASALLFEGGWGDEGVSPGRDRAGFLKRLHDEHKRLAAADEKRAAERV